MKKTVVIMVIMSLILLLCLYGCTKTGSQALMESPSPLPTVSSASASDIQTQDIVSPDKKKEDDDSSMTTVSTSAWLEPKNNEATFLKDTVLVNELDNNKKGLFYLGMTRDEVVSILTDGSVYFNSIEGDSEEGEAGDGDASYLIDFSLFNSEISLLFSGEAILLSEIWVEGDTPVEATSTQAGLNIGDTFDKMVELYGDDYNAIDKGYTYEYKFSDHYFEVWFQADVITSWRITK